MPAAHSPTAPDCAVFGAVDLIGDGWSWLVLAAAIIDETSRFAGFRAQLGVSRSTLSARLTALCTNGLMQRQGHDYQLTEMGRDFFSCLMTALAWGDRWCSDDAGIPVRAAHLGCDDVVHGELRCAVCHELVAARDVSFDRRPSPLVESGVARRYRAPDLDLLQRVHASSVAATLRVTGDRWSALLIRESFYGSRRFDEFQQRLGIATNILTNRLRRLVDLDILTRTAYQHRPARHEYRLTEKGLDLYPVPLSMLAWGDRWVFGSRPPVRLTHTKCRSQLAPVLCCNVCTHPIAISDIRFH